MQKRTTPFLICILTYYINLDALYETTKSLCDLSTFIEYEIICFASCKI